MVTYWRMRRHGTKAATFDASSRCKSNWYQISPCCVSNGQIKLWALHPSSVVFPPQFTLPTVKSLCSQNFPMFAKSDRNSGTEINLLLVSSQKAFLVELKKKSMFFLFPLQSLFYWLVHNSMWKNFWAKIRDSFPICSELKISLSEKPDFWKLIKKHF
jgi:hypothetical protein